MIGHWSRTDPYARIIERLDQAGVHAPTPRDLGRLDQIHAGGIRAVANLADRVPLEQSWELVDLGGGLGGACRYLAERSGCRAVCVDFTPGLVEAGARLTALVGLDDRVSHVTADARSTGLGDGSFDCVWVQHIALHLKVDLPLWREAARLLRPGGWLALHEWVRGDGQSMRFPTPWSPSDGAFSHLSSREELERGLADVGLLEVVLEDVSEAMAAGYAAQREVLGRKGREHLRNPVLPKEGLLESIANAELNLREGRAFCLMGTARRGALVG